MRTELENRIETVTGTVLPDDVRIVGIEGTDIIRSEVIEACVREFLPATISSGRWQEDPASGIRQDLLSSVDWSLSMVAVRGDAVVGCYLLSRPGDVNAAAAELSGTGVEGLALVVLKSHRGFGIGRALRAVPEAMGFDYVVGTHLKALGNLDHWLRRRHLIGEEDDMWITAEVFNGPLPVSSPQPAP
ncbi:GNAT family N-acetyltransferase [Rhizobium laguerreae]|nr:GNAT family N-acetyltransferase [Rhizobium laguerreae]